MISMGWRFIIILPMNPSPFLRKFPIDRSPKSHLNSIFFKKKTNIIPLIGIFFFALRIWNLNFSNFVKIVRLNLVLTWLKTCEFRTKIVKIASMAYCWSNSISLKYSRYGNSCISFKSHLLRSMIFQVSLFYYLNGVTREVNPQKATFGIVILVSSIKPSKAVLLGHFKYFAHIGGVYSSVGTSWPTLRNTQQIKYDNWQKNIKDWMKHHVILGNVSCVL